MRPANPTEYWDRVFKEGKDFTSLNEVFLDKVLLPHLASAGNAGKKALDIGCGTGDLLKKLTLRGYYADGIDISQAAIDKARDYLGNDFEGKLLLSDVESTGIPQALGAYDLIFLKLVLAFIHDKDRLLEEIREKLTGNGHFILITPVVRQGVTYALPKTINISVSKNEVENLLSEHFSSWLNINQDFGDDNLEIVTYIARK